MTTSPSIVTRRLASTAVALTVAVFLCASLLPTFGAQAEDAAKDTKATNSPSATVKPFQTHELVNPLGGDPSGNKKGITNIPAAVGSVVNIFTGIIGSLALLMFVYGSFQLMTSRGSPEQVSKGKKTMLMAVVGLALTFGAYTLINLLFTGLGVK